MPSKNAISKKKITESTRISRLPKATRIGEEDEILVREGLAEDMVRELVRETISHIERYLDE